MMGLTGDAGEVERLKIQLAEATRALREIVALDADDRDPGFGASPDYWGGVFEAAEIARKALEAVPDQSPG